MGERIFGAILHEMQDYLCILVQTVVLGLLLVGVNVT
jgi:hypothetical protein